MLVLRDWDDWDDTKVPDETLTDIFLHNDFFFFFFFFFSKPSSSLWGV